MEEVEKCLISIHSKRGYNEKALRVKKMLLNNFTLISSLPQFHCFAKKKKNENPF
jgi:hypothetical protein